VTNAQLNALTERFQVQFLHLYQAWIFFVKTRLFSCPKHPFTPDAFELWMRFDQAQQVMASGATKPVLAPNCVWV